METLGKYETKYVAIALGRENNTTPLRQLHIFVPLNGAMSPGPNGIFYQFSKAAIKKIFEKRKIEVSASDYSILAFFDKDKVESVPYIISEILDLEKDFDNIIKGD